MTDQATGKMGRPRRFDAGVERTMILDAALAAMRRNGYAASSVADILQLAGVSTRSFYRHFESKDAVVAEVVRREAESVERWLRDGIAAVDDPVKCVELWLDRTLDLFFRRGQATTTALFASPDVIRSSRIPEDLTDLRRCVYSPLADVLRSAHATGELQSPNPDLDAMTMFGMLSDAALHPATRKLGRTAVRDHVVRFAWPALGITRAD
jgi:AcrR family transcriptional regulator